MSTVQQPVEVRPADLVCTCMARDPHEMLSAWAARWRPVAARLARKRRQFDPTAMMETIRLIGLIDSGRADAFSLETRHKSHHLPECPCSNRCNPLSTLSREPEAQWVSPR